jgi:hypothetical protein
METKDMTTVNDHKAKERNKWNLQMAKNNAAVLFASVKYSINDIEKGLPKTEMINTILELYDWYKEIDEVLKKELPQ